MTTDNELGKLIIKQAKIVGALASIVADQSMLINEMLVKCQIDNCTLPATMVWSKGTRCCDRHAAQQIVLQPDSEKDWKELPNAKSIRNISEYVSIMKSMLTDEDEVQ